MVAGCSREAELTPSASKEPIDLAALKPGLVLVKVNGRSVTSDDYIRRVGVEAAIFNYQSRKRPADQVEAARAQFLHSRAGLVLSELVNQALVDEYLKDKGFTASPEADDKVIARSLDALGFKGGIEKFAEANKIDPDYFRLQLLAPSRMESARAIFSGGDFSVTDEEIDAGLDRMARYYDVAVASNAVTWATASNVLFQVTNGLDFVEASKKYGVFGTDEAERWEMFEYSEIANEKLRDWAFSAPVGSIGGPFDVPDGLVIAKIVERSDGPLEPSMASELVANVTLARIGFYMVVPEPEPRTREHVREALTKWKAQNAQKLFFKTLHEGMKIEYPQGTNFVYNAEI